MHDLQIACRVGGLNVATLHLSSFGTWVSELLRARGLPEDAVRVSLRESRRWTEVVPGGIPPLTTLQLTSSGCYASLPTGEQIRFDPCECTLVIDPAGIS